MRGAKDKQPDAPATYDEADEHNVAYIYSIARADCRDTAGKEPEGGAQADQAGDQACICRAFGRPDLCVCDCLLRQCAALFL